MYAREWGLIGDFRVDKMENFSFLKIGKVFQKEKLCVTRCFPKRKPIVKTMLLCDNAFCRIEIYCVVW